MNKEGPTFGRRIYPGSKKGDLIIISGGGEETRMANTVKDVPIPAEQLDDMVSIVVEAFPDEFEGTEGQNREIILLDSVRQRYPKEQPFEVTNRTIPALMAQGVGARKIAEELLSRNPKVQTALNLVSLSKSGLEKKKKSLTSVILDHWPGFNS